MRQLEINRLPTVARPKYGNRRQGNSIAAWRNALKRHRTYEAALRRKGLRATELEWRYFVSQENFHDSPIEIRKFDLQKRTLSLTVRDVFRGDRDLRPDRKPDAYEKELRFSGVNESQLILPPGATTIILLSSEIWKVAPSRRLALFVRSSENMFALGSLIIGYRRLRIAETREEEDERA